MALEEVAVPKHTPDSLLKYISNGGGEIDLEDDEIRTALVQCSEYNVQIAVKNGLIKLLTEGLDIPNALVKLASEETKKDRGIDGLVRYRFNLLSSTVFRKEVYRSEQYRFLELLNLELYDCKSLYWMARDIIDAGELLPPAIQTLAEHREFRYWLQESFRRTQSLSIFEQPDPRILQALFPRGLPQETVRTLLRFTLPFGRALPPAISDAIEITNHGADFLREGEFMRETVRNGILSFFDKTLDHAGRAVSEHPRELPPELKSGIESVLARTDAETLERALYDKTLAPLGVKVHTARNSKLAAVLHETGGFVAHDADDCYVARPVHNSTFLRLCLDVLKEYSGEDVAPVGESIEGRYVQVCTGHRFDNNQCGIATLAFALSRSHILNPQQESLKTNRTNAPKFTIYDAGGALINTFYYPRSDGRKGPSQMDGRTDILLARTWQDVENANLIMTLLLNAFNHEVPLRGREVGKAFVREFEEILEKHHISEWLNNSFLSGHTSNTPKENSAYSILLENIARRQNDDARAQEEIRQTWITESRLQHSIPDYRNSSIHRELYERQNSLITMQVRNLLQKYRGLLYKDGYVTDVPLKKNHG